MKPLSYRYEEIQEGLTHSFQVSLNQDMVDAFRTFTGDHNPLHKDDDFAKAVSEGKYERQVVFGMLTASFYSTLAGMFIPGTYSVIHSVDIKFLNPVYDSDILTIEGTVASKNDALHLLLIKAVIKNQDGKKVSSAKMQVICLK